MCIRDRAYRHVEAASVADAVEQLLHQKTYLSHRMQPIFPTKFAGTALTVLLRKEENQDPHALDGMLAAIDSGAPGSVYVIKVEDGADIAGVGGLMGTAMAARGFAGAIVDGGVRDLAQQLDNTEHSMYPIIERLHSILDAVKQTGRCV